MSDQASFQIKHPSYQKELLLIVRETCQKLSDNNTDISNQEKASFRLNSLKLLYYSYFQNAPYAFVIVDKNGVVFKANKLCHKFLHTSKQKLEGKNLMTFFEHASSEFTLKHFTMSDEKRRAQHFQANTKEKKPLYIALSPMDNDESNEYWICQLAETPFNDQSSMADVSSYSEDEVERLHTFENLLECIDTTLLLYDEKGRILFVQNPHQMDELVGAHKVKVGKNFFEALENNQLKDEIRSRQKLVSEDLHKRVEDFELPITRNEHKYHARFLFGKLNHCFFVLVRDMTKQKVSDQCLLNADKFNTLGTLASGLAHQFNNLHHPLIAFLEEAKGRCLQDDVSDLINQALELTQKASMLTKNLLGFARQHETVKMNVPLLDIIEGALKIINEDLRQNTIELHIDVPETLWIEADRTQMEQVFLNLFVNAKHALVERKKKKIMLRAYEEESNKIILKFSDTGIGVPEENMKKIFEPLFSTKGQFASSDSSQSQLTGTGLGLSFCKQVLERFKGNISVQSIQGEGTTFTLCFPKVHAKIGLINQKSESKNGHFPYSRALVIDDYLPVRKVARLFLEKMQITVDDCENADQALSLLKKDKYDLIFLDWLMPHMSGKEFLEAFRNLPHHPNEQTPIVVCSAIEENEQECVREHYAVNAFLSKPYSLNDFQKTVENILRPQVQTI